VKNSKLDIWIPRGLFVGTLNVRGAKLVSIVGIGVEAVSTRFSKVLAVAFAGNLHFIVESISALFSFSFFSIGHTVLLRLGR